MKKAALFITAATLIFLGATVVRAAGFNFGASNSILLGAGQSINLQAPSNFSNIGMNYGHASENVSDYNPTTIAADANSLYSDGFRYIRLAVPSFTSTTTPTSSYWLELNVAQIFKQQHPDFNILCGVGAGGASIGTLTSSVEAHWINGIENDATNTQMAANCDAFAIGNEEELHNDDTTLTDAQVRIDLQTIAAWIKNNTSYTGKIEYSVSANRTSNWTGNTNIGSIDQLCVNAYGGGVDGDTSAFTTNLALFFPIYPTGCLSEWNQSATWTNFSSQTDLQMFQNTDRYTQVLRREGIPMAYFFDYSTDGNFGLPADNFAVKLQNGTFRQSYYALTNVFK